MLPAVVSSRSRPLKPREMSQVLCSFYFEALKCVGGLAPIFHVNLWVNQSCTFLAGTARLIPNVLILHLALMLLYLFHFLCDKCAGTFGKP